MDGELSGCSGGAGIRVKIIRISTKPPYHKRYWLELLFAIYFRIICCYNEKNGRVNFVDVWFAGNCVWERINVWIV